MDIERNGRGDGRGSQRRRRRNDKRWDRGYYDNDNDQYDDDDGNINDDDNNNQGENRSRCGGPQRYSRSGPLQSVEGWVVFVTGVHEEAQEEDIIDAFSEYGLIKSVHVNMDRKTGLVKGYALVKYDKQEQAQDAINSIHGTELLGKKVGVDWAFCKSGGTSSASSSTYSAGGAGRGGGSGSRWRKNSR